MQIPARHAASRSGVESLRAGQFKILPLAGLLTAAACVLVGVTVFSVMCAVVSALTTASRKGPR